MKNSIRRQMQVWLMTPLLILLVVSAVCSYILAMYLAREAYDLALLNSVDSLASRIKEENNTVIVGPLPQRTLSLMTHQGMDLFLWEVFTEDGKLLTPDQGLPKPPHMLRRGEPPVLRYELVNDKVMRIATNRAPLPESNVLIQCGETLNSRKDYRRKLLLAIVIPQMALLSLAVAAVWIAIEKGLRPLQTISEAVRNRPPADLSPIVEENAPSEVKSFLTALNGLLYRVRDDLERQQRFAGNAAHQLRTPLAGLKTYLQVLEKNSKDAEFSKMIVQMSDGVERIIRTVQQLLSLSRAEQGLTALKTFDMVDLNAVVEEAATEIVPESLKKNVELDINTPDLPTKIHGDAISLKELAANLLENAVKYNHSGGHVNVSVTNGNTVQLIVEDDGLGIPEEERHKIFERFYRVSRASHMDISGSGLGLSIVTEIAKIHGASVRADSGKDSKGTRITVTFPTPKNNNNSKAVSAKKEDADRQA